MRLQPVENPNGLMMKIGFWFARRKFGKVITPMKVVTARVPTSMRMSYEIAKMMEHGFSLDARPAVPAARAHLRGQPMPLLHRYREGHGVEAGKVARQDRISWNPIAPTPCSLRPSALRSPTSRKSRKPRLPRRDLRRADAATSTTPRSPRSPCSTRWRISTT